MERAPAWATGWGFRGTRATRSSAASSRSPMWQSALGLGCRASGGRKKSRQVPDSNPRPPDPQPSFLTTRTRELDAFQVCIFISSSARGASSSPRLEERGGRRRPRERHRIRLSPNGGSRDWMGSHWSALLAVCWLLHPGLFALPVSPRWGCLQCRFLWGCGGLHALGWRGLHECRIPHRRRVPFSSGDGGSYSARVSDGALHRAWGFVQIAWTVPQKWSHLALLRGARAAREREAGHR